jgi:hypothetical protein
MEDGMGGACIAYGEIRNAHIIMVGKPEEKRPLVRPRRRWEDNIERILGLENMDLELPGSG